MKIAHVRRPEAIFHTMLHDAVFALLQEREHRGSNPDAPNASSHISLQPLAPSQEWQYHACARDGAHVRKNLVWKNLGRSDSFLDVLIYYSQIRDSLQALFAKTPHELTHVRCR